MGRVLAVDPGEARLGLAVSDPTRTIARPLRVFEHQSREADSDAIIAEAERQEAEVIVVGLALDQDGQVGPQARRALRLVDALRGKSALPIETWDESGSTIEASRSVGRTAGVDARAAAVILQVYLDARR